MAGRTRREINSRLSTGHVVMVLAGALGVLLTLAVLRSADNTRPVLVAAHDLAPGTTVAAESLRVARVHVDPSILATLYLATDSAGLRGRVVTTPMRSGELVVRGSVSSIDAHSSSRVMSFALTRARAVDGKLANGDRVDVVAVDHDSGRAGYVLTDAEVVAIEGRSGGALSGASDDVTVTLVVEATTAPLLAAAIDAGTVVLVRATGAPVVTNQVPFVARSGK